MEYLKKQILVYKFIILLLVLAFFAGAVYASNAERTAPPPTLICPAGQTCHAMIGEGSHLFILCAGCDFAPLIENGDDSWLVVGEGGARD